MPLTFSTNFPTKKSETAKTFQYVLIDRGLLFLNAET